MIGKGVCSEMVSYTALALKDDKLIVEDSEGFIHIKPLTDFRYPPDKNGKDIRQKQALELQLEGLEDGKERILNISYLTGGITLTPHYNIVLSEGKLVLNADVEVDNRTGKSYEEVELAVILGDVGMPYLPRKAPRIRRFAALVAGVTELAEEVTRFEEAGQIGYAFGRKDLPKGDSRFSVFKTKELDYQIVYRTNLGVGKPKINAVLEFKAPTTLQGGSVAVYAEKLGVDEKSRIERYEGGGAISSVLKDKDVDIALRTPDTLEMKVEQLGETNIVKTDLGTEAAPVFALEKEFKATAKNAGKDDVTIETYLGLSETEKVLESKLKQHEESTGKKVRWDIEVKAGTEVVFTYKTQNIQFTPAPEHIIR